MNKKQQRIESRYAIAQKQYNSKEKAVFFPFNYVTISDGKSFRYAQPFAFEVKILITGSREMVISV